MKPAIVILSLLFSIGCRTEKHTGPVTVQARSGEPIYQLLRPNNELFVMDMAMDKGHQLPVAMQVREGDSFTDIVYYDVGFKQAFVKAEGYKPVPTPAPPVTSDQQALDNFYNGRVCWVGTDGVQHNCN